MRFPWPALFLLACGGVPSPARVEPPAVAASERPPASIVGPRDPASALDGTASSRAVFTVVLTPDGWPRVVATLTSWLGEVTARRLLGRDALRPEDLLALLDSRWPDAVANLPAQDRARPVVARLFEPRIRGLAGVLSVAEGRAAPYRHVFLVPSQTPNELASQLFARLACEGERSAATCLGWKVALVPREDEVVLVLQGDASDVRARAPSESLATSPLSVTYRPEGLAEFAAGEGARALHQALSVVPSESREKLRATGMAELAGAYLRTQPFGRELDALRVGIEPGVGLRLDARLTARGAALVGGSTPEVAAPPPSERGFVHVTSGWSLPGSVARAGAPFGFPRLAGADDVHTAWRECGVGCVLQALSAPLSYAGLARRVGLVGFDGKVTFAHSPSALPGRLDADVDVARAAAELGAGLVSRGATESLPRIHLRSRVRGASWVGILSPDPDRLPPEPRELEPAPDAPGDVAQLACLERLGLLVVGALHAQAQGLTGPVPNALHDEARLKAACVRDAALVPDRDAWLSLLDRR